MKFKKMVIVLFCLLLLALIFWNTAVFRLPLNTKKMNLAGRDILVWVADTKETRLKGLQNIIWLPRGRGMLFVFEEPDRYCFWNKNTLIPLKLVFMFKDKIVSEAYLKPIWQGEQTVCPNQPVDAVIEINKR